MSTQDLQWLITRKSNSFLVKQKGLQRVFSREPGNLMALHSYKYSDIINDKNVSVEAAPDNKGVVVTIRKSKASPRTIKNARQSFVIKGGARRVAGSVAKIVAKSGYRPDLRQAAVARATAIINEQTRPVREQRIRMPRGPAAIKAHGAASVNTAPAMEEN